MSGPRRTKRCVQAEWTIAGDRPVQAVFILPMIRVSHSQTRGSSATGMVRTTEIQEIFRLPF
jgi:hypothetical protein